MNSSTDPAREQLLDEALAFYLKEMDAGRAPHWEDLAARYPDLATELQVLLIEHDRLNQAFTPLRPAAAAARAAVLPALADPVATTASGSPLTPPGLPDVPGYELLEPIARGGMAVVWKARDRKLQRLVALKFVLSGAWATPIERQRFRNEAESAAHLDHPNIVPIYEVGETQGQAYLSMKLLEGGALADHLEAFRYNSNAAARLLVSIARAVHYAHERGILHRDLKPANVLLDSQGQAFVTDFGLAKRVTAEPASDQITETGALLGTPAYMAPEQAAGRPASITVAADVYGLGAILYALLTGHAPFRGDGVLATLEQVKNQAPESPRKNNAAVARDLELICLKCLHKEPHRRYASAAALADELERYCDGRPLLSTRPVGNAERLLSWCRRNPAVAALTAGVALALVAVAVVATVAYFRLRTANDKERASRILAEQNLAVARDAVAYFARVSEEPQMQKRGLEKLRRELRTRAKDFYVQLTAHQPEDPRLAAEHGRALINLGHMVLLLGSPRDALPSQQQALAIFERLDQDHPGTLEYQDGMARALLEQGALFQILRKLEDARAVLVRALGIQRRVADRYPDSFLHQNGLARAYFELGRLHQVNNQPDKARDLYEEALNHFDRLAHMYAEPDFQANLARTHINLGTVYALPQLTHVAQAPANQVQAMRHYDAARDILGKLDKDNAEYRSLFAEVHHLIGRVHRDGGRPQEAVAPFDVALAVLMDLTQKYTDVPDYQFRLGAMYHAQGSVMIRLLQLDRAAVCYSRAAEATESLVREYDLPDYQAELGALCYDRACLAGLQAEALNDSPLAAAERGQKLEQLTQEACEQLGKSWDTGFLQRPNIFAHFQRDFDFAAFRDRDDFKKLVADFDRQKRGDSRAEHE